VQEPQGVFRANADAVAVDVAVTRDAVSVAGLAARDFKVVENGVQQQIDSVTVDAEPIDCTLVVDLGMAFDPSGLAAEVGRLPGALRSQDRVRVLSVGTDVSMALPWQSAQTLPSVSSVPLARAPDASINDGIFLALSWLGEPGRRHLIVAVTGNHWFSGPSMIGPQGLLQIASRADGVLHVVGWIPYVPGTILATDDSRAFLQGWDAPLAQAALATGGDIRYIDDRSLNMVNQFSRQLAAFRQSYILHYRPQGVKREGWHALTVTVPGQRRVVVRARKGYFVG
jgi:hypothetical protein